MEIIEKQLDFLNQTMKETAAEANGFLLKYHFGGIIAVIALLNTRWELLDAPGLAPAKNTWLLAAATLLVMALSLIYFVAVMRRYRDYLLSHRRLKYKHELSLHCLLCEGDAATYQYYLEQSVKAAPQAAMAVTLAREQRYSFEQMAHYLLDHHRRKYGQENQLDRLQLGIALLIIAITLTVRISFLAH